MCAYLLSIQEQGGTVAEAYFVEEEECGGGQVYVTLSYTKDLLV